LTANEATAFFELALNTLVKDQKALLSMTQLVDAYAVAIANALAVATGELHLQETAPPWVKEDRRKKSNTTV
jgi:hypothetical protein